METAKQEQHPNEPSSSKQPNDFHDFVARVKVYLKQWPKLVQNIFKNPKSAIRNLPDSGPWEEPAVFLVASGFASGLISALEVQFLKVPGLALTMIFTSVIGAIIGGFVFGFILNGILGAITKEPGLYRTVFFLAVISVASPIAGIASFANPILGMGVFVAALYYIFLFVKETKETETP